VRRLLAVIATALVAVLAAVAAAGPGDRHAPDAAVAPAASEPTPETAVAAAIGYLTALRWDVVVDPRARRRVIEQHATAASVAQLARQLEPAAEGLRAVTRRGLVVARTAILGYRIRSAEPTRVTVRIWGMVLFGTRTYRPTTQWSTSDIQLVLQDERWLVEDVTSRGGPSPDDSIRTLVTRTRGLEEVRHVP
jgi:hypothetical protein